MTGRFYPIYFSTLDILGRGKVKQNSRFTFARTPLGPPRRPQRRSLARPFHWWLQGPRQLPRWSMRRCGVKKTQVLPWCVRTTERPGFAQVVYYGNKRSMARSEWNG